MKKIIKGEIITKKQTINSKKAVMIGCGFVGSASVFALMQSGLFTEIVLIDADKDKADELMSEVLKMQDEFVTRISHTEPGNVKVFYKKFRADFNAKVNEIIEAIGKLN